MWKSQKSLFLSKIDQDNCPDEKVCSKTSDKKSPINRYKIKNRPKWKKIKNKPQERRHFLMANSVEIGRKTANKAVW